MQLNWRNIEFQHAHVLYDQRIHARFIQLNDLLAGWFKFAVVQNGIKGNKYPWMIAVRKLHQSANVFDGIAGIVPRAKAWAADIDRVRAVQNGFSSDFGGFGWGE